MAPRSRGTVSAGARSGGDGSVSTSTRSSTRRENGTPRRSVSSPSATRACSERSMSLRVDVQKDERLARQTLGRLEHARPGEPLERPLEVERRGGREDVGGQPHVAVRAAPAKQAFVADDAARREVEDRLELDEELAHRQLVREPERLDLLPRARQRRQVAHGVPFRLAHVLGRHAHAIGQGPDALLQVLEEELGRALDEQAPGPPVHGGARPDPTERRGDSALGLQPVGPDEDGACLPPAIKPAKYLAVQNASGCFHRTRFYARAVFVNLLFPRTAP